MSDAGTIQFLLTHLIGRIPQWRNAVMLYRCFSWFILALPLCGLVCLQKSVTATQQGATADAADAILGRWDFTVKTETGEYPSWFEIKRESTQLKGRIVGPTGSAHPIDTIRFNEGLLEFLASEHEDWPNKLAERLVFRAG
jgi:hypothetical protein